MYLRLVIALVCLYFPIIGSAREFSGGPKQFDTDTEPLVNYLHTKSAFTSKDKAQNIIIYGDVRAKYGHLKSTLNDKKQRGSGSNDIAKGNLPILSNRVASEVNMYFLYQGDPSYSTVQLKFDNPGGTTAWSNSDVGTGAASPKKSLFGSQVLNKISLRKAYLGYNLFHNDSIKTSLEVGRRRFYDTYDSKVQFFTLYDGITLSHIQNFQDSSIFQLRAAAFLIDSTVNKYGWISEVSLLNLKNSGVDIKYSYIDWGKYGRNRYDYYHAAGNQFRVSQALVAYSIPGAPKLTKIYAAYLHNSAAQKERFTANKRANNGFYFGATIGEVKKKNDWSFDCNYQWVQAQTIPERDVRGISRDNPHNISMYVDNSFGFANYKGYSLDGLYMLTDNLVMEAKFERAHQCQKSIGGRYQGYWFEINALYAF